MLNLRNKSVNVERKALIEVLKANLEVHKVQFAEAQEVYHRRLQLELQDALDIVNAEEFPIWDTVKNIRISFNPPSSHEDDYLEVIEMLEVSVDDNINLDAESFKAYYKNEWSWSAPLTNMIALNKTYI